MDNDVKQSELVEIVAIFTKFPALSTLVNLEAILQSQSLSFTCMD